MTFREGAPLAPYTTFHLGGPARVFVEARTEEDIDAARGEAARRKLPLLVLGGGSNILVPDEGVDALVVKMNIGGIKFREEGDHTLLIAGAGEKWDAVVDAAAAHGLWGVENLAGIPGTVGGAVVQNIGAYGAALSDTLAYVDVFDARTGETRQLTRDACAFGYRTSAFKRDRDLIVIRAALALPSGSGGANLSYRDANQRYQSLEHALAGVREPSPAAVAAALRAIRAEKFPDLSREGTAGSFFANPVIPQAQADLLLAQYPNMPIFALPEVADVKVPVAWIIDNVLHLRGYAHGAARLFENHALVIVAKPGATATEVDTLAREIAARVKDMTGIELEREVETFGARA